MRKEPIIISLIIFLKLMQIIVQATYFSCFYFERIQLLVVAVHL